MEQLEPAIIKLDCIRLIYGQLSDGNQKTVEQIVEEAKKLAEFCLSEEKKTVE